MDLFGSGYCFGRPTQDALGNAITTGQPVVFATNQEITWDVNFNLKKLMGQSQMVDDLRRGAVAHTGKIKNGRFFGAGLNMVLFGQPSVLTAGTLTAISAAVASVPIAATITPVVPNSGTFVQDVCVVNASTGVMMTPVAGTGALSAGQYHVAGGTYSFSSGDVTAAFGVFINYQYTASVTAAYTQSPQNLPMGSTPFFSLSHTVPLDGKYLTLLWPRVTLSKFSANFKNEDFFIPECDWEACRDPVSGNIMTWSTSE